MARSSDLSRLLDQKGGRAAVALLAPLLNRHRPLPSDARRVAIIQPTAIGDAVIGSGAVAAVRRRYPAAHVALFHGASNAAAIAMLPGVTPLETAFANPLKALAALRAFAPDLIVDLTPWPYTTAIVARLAAPVIVGFAPGLNDRGKLFDIAVEHRIDRHERDNLAAMARLFDDSPYSQSLALAPHGIDPHEVERLVLLHVRGGGSRERLRRWPDANWVALTHALNRAGYHVGFTGAPGDAVAIDPILVALGRDADAMSLAGRLTLAQLGQLIADAPLLITVETGILHIASAVEARVIGLHGPARSWRWGSLSPNARSIDSPHPDAGYIYYGFEDPPDGAETMPAISAQTVIDAALEMLAARTA